MRRRRKRSYKIPTIFIVILSMLMFNLQIMSQNMAPTILRYAEVQTRKLSTLVINKAISRHVLENLDQTTMMSIERYESGSISSITFNTLQLNQLLTQTTNIVQLNLKSVEQGKIDKVEYSDLGIEVPDNVLKRGIIYEIPFGIATNNVILSSIGPKIPVKFHLVGDVISSVTSEVKPYGINNVLIELMITVTVSQQVVIPLASSVTQVTNNIPVAIKVIQGEVPEYYIGAQTITGDSVTYIFNESEAV